jgi:D-glycero-alpha-D-manno-heptose-7-phosphate kinase
VVLEAGRIAELQSHLLLFFTGFSRMASDIAREQIARTAMLTRELSTLHGMVDEAQAILCGGRDITEFGRLLHDSWMIKRSLTPQIAPAAIDDIYAAARRAGATGGKLAGAGGGGFMMLFAPPERHHHIRLALSELLEVPFAFERTGSELVVYQPEPAAVWDSHVTGRVARVS